MTDSGSVMASDQVLQSLADSRSSTPCSKLLSEPTTPCEELGTPTHPLTTEELRFLLKPGDTVTTSAGHRVKVVQDKEGRLLFHSPHSSKAIATPPTQQPSSQAAASVPNLSQKKRTGGVTLLTAIDPRNIINLAGHEDSLSTPDTPPTPSIPLSSYSFRNRKARQSKLIYDIKYHPIDDSIRPSQAAKRRSAHGEVQLFSDDQTDSFFMHADSDSREVDSDEEETKTKSEATEKGKKRARYESQSPEPTRRSSRRIAAPKVSYNMNVHPQDDDPEMSTTDSDDSEISLQNDNWTKLSRSIQKKTVSHQQDTNVSRFKDRTGARSVVGTDSDITDVHDEPTCYSSEESTVHDEETTSSGKQDTVIKTSLPLSFVATPPLYGVRRRAELDVWKLGPSERYFAHDRDSWPILPVLPFEIHAERLEDQLVAEAKAASPLNFDLDDKENDMANNRVEESSNILDMMTIIPASQYRRTIEDSNASHHHLAALDTVFDEVEYGVSPHGLGGSDGAHEQHTIATGEDFILKTIRFLASNEQLPLTATVNDQEDDGDSVIGPNSSTAVQ